MHILPINNTQHYSNTSFNGNKNPIAVLEKQKDVLNALNIGTGDSFIASYLRKENDHEISGFFDTLWVKLKNNIPIANTVEKLELLKTYGISLLSYTPEEVAKFMKFLKSNPSDKDVFFLQTAMDIARIGEIKKIEEGKSHFIFDDFQPVLDYVLSDKKGKIHLTQFTKSDWEKHIDAMIRFYHNNGIKTGKEDANNVISGIQNLLSGGYWEYAYTGNPKYLPISIKSSRYNDKYINICGIKYYKNNNSEISIGLSKYKLDFYEDRSPVPPTEKQLFVLLDENGKLSKLKLYIYQIIYQIKHGTDDYKYYKEQYEFYKKILQSDINHYESPFQDRLPTAVTAGVDASKYSIKTIEYDTATKTAELKQKTFGGLRRISQSFRLVDSSSDKLGIMVDENNPISFMPLEPTNYDLEQMINNEKTNNLIKILNFSGWKDTFTEIISKFST